MNFLLHRHLALRDFRDGGAETSGPVEVASLGSMLPDLWSLADRSVRARAAVDRPSTAVDPRVDALLDGIDHHLRADAWFHRHPVFREGEAELASDFRDAEVGAAKMGLLGHIGWELCLDGALLRRQGLDVVLEGLARGVEAAGGGKGGPLVRAVEAHHPDFRHDHAARHAFVERVESLLASLLAGGWIGSYARGRGIVDRLSGVRRHVGLSPIGTADAECLAEILDRALDRADARLDALLDDPIPPAAT